MTLSVSAASGGAWAFPYPTPYGLMVVAGIAVAWLLARVLARRARLDPSHIDLLVPLLMLAGVGGAAVFGWLTDSLAGHASDGRVLYGSLLLAMIAGIAYCVVSRIPLGLMGDVVAAPLALGIGIGRWGCFLAGCCWGVVCGGDFPLAVRYGAGSFAHRAQVASGGIAGDAAQSLPTHPAQLYESVAMVALAAALLSLFPRRRISGELFLLMGGLYGLARFCIEFLRADNPPLVMGLSFSQLIALATTAAAAVTFFFRRAMADRLHLRLAG